MVTSPLDDEAMRHQVNAFLEQQRDEWMDKGTFIQNSFDSLRVVAFPEGVSAERIEEAKCMFFAGAHCISNALLQLALDPNREPTEADAVRIDGLLKELAQFGETFAKKLQESIAPRG